MIKLTSENTANAVKRCKQLRPTVRFIADRVYEVRSSNNLNVYYVCFDVKDGEKFGECDCKAGQQGKYPCYHIVGAATANIYRQGLKQVGAVAA